ncbi:MAG: hypothetical protein Q4E88_00710 [Coriobacteriia bacterium]|nr:hypothetical protein [Coriobacteriia bacterium]
MKNVKVKIAIVSLLSIVFCCICLFGVNYFNQNEVDNSIVSEEANYESNQPAQSPVIEKAGSLPQSADEVFNAVPSRQTLDNIPGYINKSIELLNEQSTQEQKTDVEPGGSGESDPNDNPLDFECHQIYATLIKDGSNQYNLVLSANEPSENNYEKLFIIKDTDTGVPGYCKDYSSKITSVEIENSVRLFHPISTMQWFGSYVSDSSDFSYSSLKSISGLKYINMDKVVNSAFMFSGTKSLESLNEADIDYIKANSNYFKSLENAAGMFIDTGLDENTLDMFLTKLSNSDVLKNCQYAFSLCSNLTKFESKNIVLPKVENASSMFSRSALESFNDNVVFGHPIYSITAIFYECHNLKTVDASSMLENGTSLYVEKDGSVIANTVSSSVSAFQSCEKLTYVDLGKWDLSNNEESAHINYTADMFSGCSSLTTIDTRFDADWSQTVKESSNMFAACTSLVGQNRTAYNAANIYGGLARIDEGKCNPGYFSLSKNSPEAQHESLCFLDYDDSVVEKVTNITGDKTYFNNTLFNYDPDFKFKVVMKDSLSVPRVYDGINELKYDNGVFTVGNRYGLHCIYIDKQTKFDINFDKDEHVFEITDKNGNEISDFHQVMLNDSFEFKVKYNEWQPYIIKEVKVNGETIKPDHDNCYTINNISTHKNVQIISQEANMLKIRENHKNFSYRPVFKTLSFDQVQFYDNEGKLIWPSVNYGHDYVMSDLKNVCYYTGTGYKFQGIRFDNDTWKNFFDGVKDGKATSYKGRLATGDYCSTLSFDNENSMPIINDVYLGDFVRAYNLDERIFWYPDVLDNDNSYVFHLSDTKDSGFRDTDSNGESHNAVIQHEFSDVYSVKFEADDGVKQIVDANGKDITNGAMILKDSQNFEFKIKCLDDRGTESVQQAEVSINGNENDLSDLIVNNDTLKYTLKNVNHADSTGHVVKIKTTYVNSFMTNRGLYHPVFDTEGFPYIRFFDNDGQCLNASKRYLGFDYNDYVMSDTAYATKYKILSKADVKITAVRSVTTPLEWEDTFDRDGIGNGNVTKLQDKFRQENIDSNDTVHFFTSKESPSIGSISLGRIYEAYKNTGFGIKQGNNSFFHFWTNDINFQGDLYHHTYYYDSYDSSREVCHFKDIHIGDEVPNGCCLAVTREFGKADPACKVEFHKDEGIEKITDDQGNNVKCGIPYTVDEKGSNFTFHVQYKDGYVENSVKDGASILNYDKENNSYTIENIIGPRIINISSTKSISLKSSKTSKHPDLIYKPVFKNISVYDVKFYDTNGHFIQPSQDNGTSYIMSDLKDAREFITYNPSAFKVIGLLDHSWDEAFGEDTQEIATSYVYDDLDCNDSCENLAFNRKNKVKIDDISFDEIKTSYNFENDLYLGNETISQDLTYCYKYPETATKGEWWQNIQRTQQGTIVISKKITNTPKIHFSKDIGAEKFIDDKGHVINDSLNVPYGSDFRFKVVNLAGFTNEVIINNHTLKPESDGYFRLVNINSEITVKTQSKTTKVLQSLYADGDLYHPVFDKLSSKDIRFYDAKGNLLKANGDEVPDAKGYRYYVMSDIASATQYDSDIPNFSLTAVRSIIESEWENIFDHKDADNGDIFDLQDDFKAKLHAGDNVCFFKHYDMPQMPTINSVPLNRIYEAYNKVGFGLLNTFHFWTNHIRGTIWVAFHYAYYFNSYTTETDNRIGLDVDGGCAMVVSRQFNSRPQNINFVKSEATDSFIDPSGNTLNQTVQNPRSNDFKFSVKLKDGYAIDKVYANETEIVPYDNIYRLNSPVLDVNITVTYKKTQPLRINDDLYHPIFAYGQAKTSDIKFYDESGHYLPPKGYGDSYNMEDLKNATQYIAKDTYQFKAVRLKTGDKWSETYGNVEQDIATKYNGQMNFGENCTSLGFHYSEDSKDINIKDINDRDVSLTLISIVYFSNYCNCWTSDSVDDSAWVFGGHGIFRKESKNNTASTLFDRTFSGKNCNINFSYDENIEKITDLNGTNIDDSPFLDKFSAGTNLKFKVNTKDNYLVNEVYCNGTNIYPNFEGVYVVPRINEDTNIVVKSAESKSLMVGDKIFHPVFEYLSFPQIKFYDNNNCFIHPTGNNGYSYKISDLANATQFVADDYSFDAVSVDRKTWIDAFGDIDSKVNAPKYLPELDSNQSCASLNFEVGQTPYISGRSINEVVNAYFSDNAFWSPCSVDIHKAAMYDMKYEWLFEQDKSSVASFLISTTFSSKKSLDIKLNKDEGVNSFVDDNGETLSDIVKVLPGQEIRFKPIFNDDYVKNTITFSGQEVKPDADGYYRIVANTSAIQNSLNVETTSLKTVSLKVNDVIYRPIIDDDNGLSVSEVKFYNESGEYIKPVNGLSYRMADLKDAVRFSANGKYDFKAVGMISHTWDEAFGSTIGVANEYLAGDIDGATRCVSLDMAVGTMPIIQNHELLELKNIYSINENSFWGNESYNENVAAAFEFNETNPSGQWIVNPRTDIKSVVALREFKNSYTFNFSKDDGVSSIVDENNNPINENIEALSGKDFRFKVVFKPEHIKNFVTINGQETSPDSDGFYTVKKVYNNSNIEVVSYKTISLIVDNKYLYHPVANNLSTDEIIFFDSNGNKLEPTGLNNKYVLSDLQQATQFTAVDNAYPVFQAVRSVNSVKWDDVYKFEKEDELIRDNCKYGFNNNLISGDSVLIFYKSNNVESEPLINGIGLTSVYNAYKNVGFGTDKGLFWSNYCKYADWYFHYYAYAWNCIENHIQGNVHDDEDEMCDVVIVRDFPVNKVYLNKDDGVLNVTDSQGHIVHDEFGLLTNSDYKFKIETKPGYGVSHVTYNGTEVLPDENAYYHIASTVDGSSQNITITTKELSSLNYTYDGKIYNYKPVFKELPFSKIKFYDYDGNIIIPEDGSVYHIKDLKNVLYYVMDNDVSFNAIRLVNESWMDAFGEDLQANDYRGKKFNEEECTTLTMDKPADKTPPKIEGISVNEIINTYFNSDHIDLWSTQKGDDGFVDIFHVNKTSGEWVRAWHSDSHFMDDLFYIVMEKKFSN